MNEPIKVFISYSHKDDALRQELIPHLSSAQKEGLIELWHDREIRAGADWAEEIDEKLELADIILFLVSADFINSRYCSGIEMTRAIERHQAQTAHAVPIIIRFSDWTSTCLGELQAVPRDNKPITSWGDDLSNPIERDEPWLLVVKEISQVAKEIRDRRIAELTAAQKTESSQAFRSKVEKYYQDSILSAGELELLNIEREALGLGETEAAEILQSVAVVYQQHQSNLEKYHRVLVAELAGKGSLRADQRVILQELQAALGISDSEAEQVEQKALTERVLEQQQAKEAGNEQVEVLLKEAQVAIKREQNLRRFREELQHAVKAEYPLNGHIEAGLLSFRLSLNLTDAEIAPIKADVFAIPEALYQEQVRRKDELERQRRSELEQRRKAKEKRLNREQAEASQSFNSRKETSIQFQSFDFDVITVDEKGDENKRSKKTAKFFTEDLGEGTFLNMIYVPGGTFQIGISLGGTKDQIPQHSVTVPTFLMGKYLVTQAQWRMIAMLPIVKTILKIEPSYFKGDNLPVECISWTDTMEFCQRLSYLTGHSYRLPSEAEWEYACLAGTNTYYHFGETLTPKLARCNNANFVLAMSTIVTGKTASVGSYLPNAFGLYDMHGNLWEWCTDTFHSNYIGAPTDGTAWIENGSNRRILRGGSWIDLPINCGAMDRNHDHESFDCHKYIYGFRVVCAVF
jgi:formylglycine-generating enzyme required for sulfatase activity